jgi:DNA-binding response OmpR family regulator
MSREDAVVSERVLVVDDDPTVADVVVRYLEREGFAVEACCDGEVALRRAIEEPPTLMVLDLMLPGLDGFEVCRRLRRVAPVPVIMLTARGDEEDRVMGLELGADDYVGKPFSPRELTARVKAVLRRAHEPAPSAPLETMSFGTLVIDAAARQVTVDDAPAVLTAREFDLLVFLARSARRTFRREELLEHVWGFTTATRPP